MTRVPVVDDSHFTQSQVASYFEEGTGETLVETARTATENA